MIFNEAQLEQAFAELFKKNAWVNFLITKMQDENEYKSLFN